MLGVYDAAALGKHIDTDPNKDPEFVYAFHLWNEVFDWYETHRDRKPLPDHLGDQVQQAVKRGYTLPIALIRDNATNSLCVLLSDMKTAVALDPDARPKGTAMTLPRNTFVKHINGNGLDNRRDNLLLVSGQQDRKARRKMDYASTVIDGQVVYMHDLIMAAMIAEGHPNAQLPSQSID